MRVGLMADIHGNADALAAVLGQMRADRVERLLVAGDFVGYYYQPGAVLRLLDEWVWHGVQGNHEVMLAEWLAGTGRQEVRKNYGSGLEQAAGLPEALCQRLLTLPTLWEGQMGGRRVVMCHAIPGNCRAYVYPDADAQTWASLEGVAADLVLYGHTHYPVVRHKGGGGVIVNPGSVGQPRDRRPGASWAFWDTKTNHVELRRTCYDLGSVMEQCARMDPHLDYLHEVLRAGLAC